MKTTDYFGQLKTAPVDRGLTYWESGSGETLLFLHGALSNGFTFRKILPELSQSFHCIALDLPLGGHHIPLSNHAELSPAGIAELIRKFLDFKKISRVTIIANDTGGAYAQVFASLHPELVSSLILSNCEVMDVFPPPKFAYLTHAVKIPGFTFLMGRLFRVKSWLTSPAVMGGLSLRITNEDLASGYLHSFVKNAGIRKDFGKACRHWHPEHTLEAAHLLHGFKKPVLVLWGDQDQKLFPKKQMEKLLDVFPHAKWQTIRDSKTYVQEDAPEEMVKAIRLFVK
ncbi:Tropinesterase [compost metagenome]